jgi:signal transduction histidine kinase
MALVFFVSACTVIAADPAVNIDIHALHSYGHGNAFEDTGRDEHEPVANDTRQTFLTDLSTGEVVSALWREHRPLALAAVGLILLQALLIGGLLVEYRRRQRAQLEARRYLAGMAHLDRRAAMGELTASLAHELNQPLTAILRNAEAARMLLARPDPPLDELRDIVDDIRSDDRRAGDIIRRLRTLLRQHELSPEPVDVNAVAQETVAFVVPDAASKDVRLDVDFSSVPGIVTGDRVHLQQVVLNLLLNGVDAVARVAHGRRRVLVRTACNDGHVDISVADTGPGFAPDVLPRAFEPFFSTKEDGMGMGLSIARSIVDAHGGRIMATNNDHGGATVRFVLPLRKEPVVRQP